MAANERQELEELRRIDELEKKASGALAEKPPASGPASSPLVAQIPTGGMQTVPRKGALAGEPNYLEKASMYAAGVPMAGLGAGLLRGATATTKAAPYTARLAEALIPETLGGLSKATGLAAASALPAEFARQKVAEAGGGKVAQELTEAGTALASGGLGYGFSKLANLLKTKIGGSLGGIIGKETEILKQKAQALGEEVKGRTATGVAERSAAEKTAATEAEARARELASQKYPQRQTQEALTESSSAVSQKLIQEQNKAAKASEEALSGLSKKSVSDENVGSLIQPLGQKNVGKLSKARQEESITKTKDPAFDRARAKEDKGEYMATNAKSKPIFDSAIADLETQVERTTEPYQSQLKARLQSLRGKEIPLSESELRVEKLRESAIPGYVAKTTKLEPMTLDQAEFMRRMLTDKDLAEQSGFAALDVARRTDVAKKLSAAMKEFEPGVAEYLSKYQEMSAPISKALAGRGKQLTQAQELAEQEVLFSADKSATAKYYLDGSQERAQRLVDLVGGKPKELVDSIAANLRGKIEKMSSEKAKEFADQGIFKVFPELKDPINKIIQAKAAQEKVAKLLQAQGAITSTGPTGRLATALKTQESLESKLVAAGKEATQTATKARESAQKFDAFNTHLGTLSGEESLTQSKKFLSQMAQEGRIPMNAYEKSLQEIRQAEEAYQKFKDSEQLKNKLRKALAYKTLGTVAGFGTAYYLTR